MRWPMSTTACGIFRRAAALASVLAETGKRLTLIVRKAVGLPLDDYGHVRLGRVPVDRQGFLLAGPASPRLFPRAIWDKRALEDALATASRRRIRVLFFLATIARRRIRERERSLQ